MSANSRGSASIIFMVVVLPFLAILAMVGIEMTQFFGMREEVRRILDAEAKQSLGRPYPSDYVARRITSSLESLQPYVVVDSVRADTSAHQGEVVVTGTFNGALSKFVGLLLRQEVVGIPFRISSGVRRAKTLGLIVLDRTIGEGEEPCDGENLSARASMVSRIARDLEGSGVGQLAIGVTPGVVSEIDLLAPNDDLPRCGGARSGYLGVESIEGATAGTFSDPIAVAYRATQLLLSAKGSGSVEQRAIVMVVPPALARSEAVPATFSLLEHEATRQSAKITEVGIVVGGARGEVFFETRSGVESGRAKYLNVSEDEAKGDSLRVALVQHIQGHTFIAR